MGLMGLVYRGMSVSRCDAVAEGLKSNHRPSPRSPNSNALRAILLPYANAYILVQLDWTRELLKFAGKKGPCSRWSGGCGGRGAAAGAAAAGAAGLRRGGSG
eukprot:scaffold36027_cov23-Tisochrysis_lutea.AAC.1